MIYDLTHEAYKELHDHMWLDIHASLMTHKEFRIYLISLLERDQGLTQFQLNIHR